MIVVGHTLVIIKTEVRGFRETVVRLNEGKVESPT